MKEIYLINVFDPEANHGEGHEFFDYRKGAFAEKEVAEAAVKMMEMFAEKDSTVIIRVQSFKFNTELTLDEWMDNNVPWRQNKAAS